MQRSCCPTSFELLSARRLGVRFASLVAGWTVLSSLAFAEIEKITLPGDYADFALDPKTGDVIAVDAEKARVLRFRQADLKGDTLKAGGEVKVGPNPVSVSFKEFGDLRVFAVGCLSDANMYLIKASDFTLLKKIPLDENGVKKVTGSINPEDPFVYYNYGTGHDAVAGVVSLREMKNLGLAFDDAEDCAINARGDIAYRRGPWGPSGFEALTRTNGLNEEKPKFARLFYDHESTRGYVPDPFGQFTAADKNLYPASLGKAVASFEFVPMGFFSSEPVIVGKTQADRRRRDEAASVTLRAASYNSYVDFGTPIKFELSFSEEGARVGGQGRGGMAKREQVFCDDERRRVLYAHRNALVVVPLADFNPPKEPLLLAELTGNDAMELGKEYRLEVVPLGKGVAVTLEDIPTGAKKEGNAIVWTPTAVGSQNIAATLKHGDLERIQRFEVSVEHPSTDLPFAPAGLVMGADGKQAVIWEGAVADRWGRVEEGTEVETPRIAVLNVATGDVMVERKLASPIRGVAMTSDYAILYGRNTPRCDVLKLDTLEREESLVASAAVTGFEATGDVLVAYSRSSADVFNLTTLKKVHTEKWNGTTQKKLLHEGGLQLNDVWHSVDLTPKMIVSSGYLPVLPSGSMRPPGRPDVNNQVLQGRDGVRTDTLPVPKSKLKVELQQKREQIENEGDAWPTRHEITIKVEGAEEAVSQVLVNHITYGARREREIGPIPWAVGSDQVIVVEGNRLYQHGIEPGNSEPEKGLRWARKQSAWMLKSDGSTVLKHELSGRDEKTKVSLLTTMKGLSLDEETLEVSIDNNVVLEEAAKVLKKSAARFKNQVPRTQELFKLLGLELKGIPVCVEIRLSASSADLAEQELRYFVLAEVPRAVLDAPTSVKGPTVNTPPRDNAVPTASAGDLKALKEQLQVATMEVGNLTEQVTALGAERDGLKEQVSALEVRREDLDRRIGAMEGRSTFLLVLGPIAVIVSAIAMILCFQASRQKG